MKDRDVVTENWALKSFMYTKFQNHDLTEVAESFEEPLSHEELSESSKDDSDTPGKRKYFETL